MALRSRVRTQRAMKNFLDYIENDRLKRTLRTRAKGSGRLFMTQMREELLNGDMSMTGEDTIQSKLDIIVKSGLSEATRAGKARYEHQTSRTVMDRSSVTNRLNNLKCVLKSPHPVDAQRRASYSTAGESKQSIAAVGPSFPGRWPRPLPPEALRPGLGGAMRAPPLQLAAQLHARCTSRLEGRLVWRCPRVAQRVRSRGPRPAEGVLQVRLGLLRHVDDARKGRRETVAGFFARRPAIPPIATCRQTRVDCPGSGSPLLPTGLGCCHTDRPGTRGVCVRRLGQHVRALHTGDASHGSAQPAPSFSRSHLSSPKPCPGFSNHG